MSDPLRLYLEFESLSDYVEESVRMALSLHPATRTFRLLKLELATPAWNTIHGDAVYWPDRGWIDIDEDDVGRQICDFPGVLRSLRSGIVLAWLGHEALLQLRSISKVLKIVE